MREKRIIRKEYKIKQKNKHLEPAIFGFHGVTCLGGRRVIHYATEAAVVQIVVHLVLIQ